MLLTSVQIVIALLMSLCILVQHRASGLTSTFGGSGAVVVQRRGAEKVLYKMTIWLSVAFMVLSLAQLFLLA